MRRLIDVMKKFYEFDKNAQKNKDYHASFAYGNAEDLWDGMLKGKVGNDLVTAIENFINAIQGNMEIEPEATEAYQVVIAEAEKYKEELVQAIKEASSN